jgi:hypothetical protein
MGRRSAIQQAGEAAIPRPVTSWARAVKMAARQRKRQARERKREIRALFGDGG